MPSFAYVKIELHNHTNESDGSLSVTALADFFKKSNISNFALTDHNTISGHSKLDSYFSQMNQSYIRGMELTTYYGHLLFENLTSYIAWDDLQKSNLDSLLKKVHSLGGLVGIAHPFSAGSPLSNGMRFSMQIHDYDNLDFVEIINHAHPFEPDNLQAISWWESLYLNHHRISPTSGLDLHQEISLENAFSTYLLLSPKEQEQTLAAQLTYAISHNKTCVSRGPILFSWASEHLLHIHIESAPETTDEMMLALEIKTALSIFLFPVISSDLIYSFKQLHIITSNTPVILKLWAIDSGQKVLYAISTVPK